MSARFFVPGTPVGQPRHRVGRGAQGRPRAYLPASHPVHAFKAAVRLAASEAGVEPFPGPVAVSVEIVVVRPKSHLRRDGRPRKGAPRYPGKPDADNVAKAVLDALEGVAFRDDSAVATLIVHKSYGILGEPAGAYVSIEDLTDEPADDHA